jgi:hypothetical protein
MQLKQEKLRRCAIGFEVAYKYHEKTDEGYDMENVHELKRKVGKAYDETSYERLAAAIMGQFARRDIMVTDVAIMEFVKKEISFRETKNGICIKNKKYLFDGTTEIEFAEEVEPQVQYVPQPVQQVAAVQPHNVQHPPQAVQAQVGAVPDPFLGKKPMRHETFEPDDVMASDARKRGLKFTRGNKYPIYEEKQDRRGIMFGMLYVTKDDAGQKQILSDRLFVFKQELVGGSQFDDRGGVELDYGSGLISNTQAPIYGN